MINNVVLVGRCGREPEVRHFQSGKKVAEVSMAVDKPSKDKDKKDTCWFQIKAWDKGADILSEYLKKGHLFGVTGHLDVETWEDSTGSKRSKVVVIADRIQLMQPKKDGEGSSSREQESSDPYGGSSGSGAAASEQRDIFGSSDEIPF